MNRNIEEITVNGKTYKINTDFRIAIECNKIAEDKTIGDYERALAIIYKLFGDEALEDNFNHEKLLDEAINFLLCGKEYDTENNSKPDMDFIEDMDYIEASFQSDYHISLEDTKMHWWKFNKLLCGLSNSDFGNCCILNRIRNLRNYDTSKIKDTKERREIEEAKRRFALKKYQNKKEPTEQQKKSSENFFKALGY